MIARKTLTLLLIALVLTACDHSSSQPKEPPKTKPTVSTAAMANHHATLLHHTLPVPLPPMIVAKGVLQRTIYVGTVDHPTLDGGIINAADGLPVTHAVPPMIATAATVKPMIKAPSSSTASTPLTDDQWATSPRVKRLLAEAASGGKLAAVLQKTEAMGLPASVATVPMIESNYQTQAVSPKGAAGAWQLMPSIAYHYGLTNAQRFELTPSTDTALTLLQQLHAQLGNWALTFAAYNAGEARVAQALAKNPQATTIDALDLPSETKAYVHQLMWLNQTLSHISSEEELAP